MKKKIKRIIMSMGLLERKGNDTKGIGVGIPLISHT
jgi:hypothetical protein